MKIHNLRFRGIGPFEAEQHVDFDALGRAGMFLLEGPTGVGKSTIIDAVVFALYGGVASKDSDDGRLVSDFRPLAEQPYVEMVFSCANGVFRVRRTPGYWRPKARSKDPQAVTFEHPGALLVKLAHPQDADGLTVGSRNADVGVAIRDAVGLDKEQFVSTIVLPQGQFATFLRAGSKDRRPILQKIFRTHHYEKLQQRLKDAGRAADAQRASAREALTAALNNFRGAVDAQQESALADIAAESSGDDIRGAVAAAVGALSTMHASAAAAHTTAAAAHESAQQALASVDARIALRDDLAAAQQRRAELDAQQAAVQRHRTDLADDERGARAADAVAHAGGTAADLAAAQAGLQDAMASAPAVLCALPIGALQEYADQNHRTIGSLAPVLEVERTLPAKEGRAAGLERTAAQLLDSEADLAARIAALPEAIAQTRAQLAKEQVLAASVDLLETERGALETRAQAARQLGAATARAAILDAELLEAVAALDGDEAEAARLNAAYRAGIAATLGASLTPGEPCPACGSLEHPNPAVPGADHATVDDVDAAARRTATARSLVEGARAARNAQEVLITGLTTAAAGLTVDGAEHQLAELGAALDAARDAGRTAPVTAARIADLEAEATQLSEQVERLRHQRTEASATADAIRAEIAEAQLRVEAERHGFATIEERVADLESGGTACDTLIACHRTFQAASHAAAVAEASLAEALQREGFADRDRAAASRLSPAQRQQAEAAVQEHDSEAIRVAAVLGRPDLEGVDPQEEIDRGSAVEALHEAKAALAERQRESNECGQVLRQAALHGARISDAVEDRERCYADTETALTLARLAEGRNVLGMDLATFVLVHRFRSVIEAANLHLTQMSNGRLILESFEEAEDKRSRAGLGIRVRDLHTETVRTPKTLSGGETFYASLSLALGLAEIVTAESGGVELDTLFVDEGFGSLDPETLDTVMGVLDGLRRNGRVLGLVSHVTEMKERIAERVEVRRVSDSGPSTLRVVA